ncbi:hypothetical protein PGTUg99_008240 [Puccinia graminis f. sp. tritici]|uniref:Uncharacterized protein n=1 Tax=Puccinia graminis f. sp. tritici TaxID=56615 RepID=A0A5B0SM26_PUCGR|nr:hypothetical protein PGTUg99_008240 [Puccinia graminis f. sp. tritici]
MLSGNINLRSVGHYPSFEAPLDQSDLKAESNLFLSGDNMIQVQDFPTRQDYTQSQYNSKDKSYFEPLESGDGDITWKKLMESDSGSYLPGEDYMQIQDCPTHWDSSQCQTHNKNKSKCESLGLGDCYLAWKDQLDQPKWKEDLDFSFCGEDLTRLQDHQTNQDYSQVADYSKHKIPEALMEGNTSGVPEISLTHSFNKCDKDSLEEIKDGNNER